MDEQYFGDPRERFGSRHVRPAPDSPAAGLTADDIIAVIADHCHDWEYWIDPDGRLLFVSPACERVSGHPAERFLADPELFISLIHPDDRDAYAARHERADATCEEESIELRIMHRDGSVRWIHHLCKPVTGPDGQPLGRRGTNRDITKYKEAEAALREQGRRFDIVTRSTRDVIWDWNVVTGEVWWSDGIESVFGYRRDEIRYDAEWWKERIHPEDRERVIASVMSCFSAGRQEWSAEYRYLKADGTYAWILDRGVVTYENGAPVRMMGAEIDLTLSADLKTRLEAAETRYALLAETSPSGIWQTDVQGNNTYVSRRWSEITGIPQDEAMGDGWSATIHPDDREMVRRGWYEAAPASDSYESEFRFAHPGGRTVWVLCISRPVRQGDGATVGWIGTITDITAIKEKETALEAANLLLKQKMTEIRTLRGILPICSHCNSIHEEDGGWTPLESYVRRRTEVSLSHSICPTCFSRFYSEYE
jgi:PAS domain S-box-containing protein